MVQRTCSIQGCDKEPKANGWCSTHYQRWHRHGDPLFSHYLQPPKTCTIDGCDAIARARGWCDKHWQRWQRWGDPLLCLRPKDTQARNLGHECSIEGCARAARAKGWCGMHHARWLKHGSTELPARPKPPPRECSIDGCASLVDTRGWCNLHYLRWRNHGNPAVYLISQPTILCSREGCGRRSAKAGMCWTHYRQTIIAFGKAQEYRCAICHVHKDDAPCKRLHLDHDHVTGRPRALLCHHCNVGLGHFKDNPEYLAAAIRYLTEKISPCSETISERS